MSNDQTPLPKPTVMLPAFVDGVGEYEEPMFDSMSMRDYGRACERAAYERIAKMLEQVESIYYYDARELAAFVREEMEADK